MLIKKLQELKSEKHMTIQEISEKSGVPSSTVSRIFSGQTDNPSFQNICDIVNAMEGSMDELWGNINTVFNEENDAALTIIKEQYQKRLEDKDLEIKRWMQLFRRVAFAFIILVGIIVALLIFDIINPKMGYVKY